MPTAKAINSYPIELIAVAEKVLADDSAVVVELKDISEARSLQMQLYGLRKAFGETEGHPLKDIAPRLSTKLIKNADGSASLTICTVDHLVPKGLRKAAEGL